MWFKVFQNVHHVGYLGYRNRKMFCYSEPACHNAPTKLQLNPTYCSEADVVLKFQHLAIWSFRNSDTPCSPNASHWSCSSIQLTFWKRCWKFEKFMWFNYWFSFTLANSRISHEYPSLFIIVINLIFMFSLWCIGWVGSLYANQFFMYFLY